MIVYKVLDSVFSTWSNISILREINKVNIGMSGREIAKRAGMSAPSCLETLTALENLNLVKRQRGGREHFFFLNREHYLVKNIIIPLFVSEDKFPDSIFSDIKKKLGKYSVSLIVFGSTARKEEKIESDLDLCVVYNQAAGKRKIEIAVSDIGLDLYNKYGISLSLYYISEKEFSRKAKSKKPPVDNIIKDGKVISGKTIREIING